jgi:hypothetical protein
VLEQPALPRDVPLPTQRDQALPPEAARVVANALALAEQALAHDDVSMACDALELAELVRRTHGWLLDAVRDPHPPPAPVLP